MWVGIRSHSLALQADAWHTISDTLSSLVVLLGVYIARRPADREHPFGHGRYELLTTLLVGAMLAWVAGTFMYKGVELLLRQEAAQFGTAAIVVTVVSIVVKEAMARITFWVARRSANTALKADGWHHRSDSLSSVVVLCGIFFGYWFWWVDGFLSIVVALMIGYVAWKTIKRASSTLVGEAPSEQLQQEIEIVVRKCIPQQNLAPHELTLHIVLPDAMTVGEAHQIIATIEAELLQQLRLNATVHIEPTSKFAATGTNS